MKAIIKWDVLFRFLVITNIILLFSQVCGCIHIAKETSVVFENRTNVSNSKITVTRHYSINSWTSTPFYGTTPKSIASFSQSVSPDSNLQKLRLKNRLLLHFPSFGSEQWTRDRYGVLVDVKNYYSDYGINFPDSTTLKKGVLSWLNHDSEPIFILKEIPVQIKISKPFEQLAEILSEGDEYIPNILVRYEQFDSTTKATPGKCSFFLYISDPDKDSIGREDSVFTVTKKMLALFSDDTSVVSEKMEIEVYLKEPLVNHYSYIFPVEPDKNRDTVVCDLDDEMRKTIEDGLTTRKNQP